MLLRKHRVCGAMTKKRPGTAPAAVKKVVNATKNAKSAISHLKKVAKQEAPVLKGSGEYRPTLAHRTLGGRGDYASQGSSIGSAIGKGIGSIADGIGSVVKLFGGGDYHKSAIETSPIAAAAMDPSMDGLKLRGSIMQFHAANGGTTGGFRFRKVELLGPVLATGVSTFSTTSYRIQPGQRGLNTIMPLGSQIAQCFQKYILHGMVFTYVSSSSCYTSNVGVGSVYLSTLYNAEADPLATEAEVANNVYTTFGRPFDSIVHGIECASKESPVTTRYIRASNAAVAGADERLDDVGIFQVSLVGNLNTNGTELGHVYVTYDIEFLQPILPDVHVGTTAQFVNMAMATNANLSLQTADPANSIPCSWLANSNILQLPQGFNGNYMLVMLFCVDGVITTAPSLSSAGSELTSLNLLPGQNSGTLGSQQSFFKNNTSPTNSFAVWCYTFSTIAATGSTNNRVNVAAPAWTGGNNATLVTFLLPLDNDITVDLSNPMSLFLRRLPKNERKTMQSLLEYQDMIASSRIKQAVQEERKEEQKQCSSSSSPPVLATRDLSGNWTPIEIGANLR